MRIVFFSCARYSSVQLFHFSGLVLGASSKGNYVSADNKTYKFRGWLCKGVNKVKLRRRTASRAAVKPEANIASSTQHQRSFSATSISLHFSQHSLDKVHTARILQLQNQYPNTPTQLPTSSTVQFNSTPSNPTQISSTEPQTSQTKLTSIPHHASHPPPPPPHHQHHSNARPSDIVTPPSPAPSPSPIPQPPPLTPNSNTSTYTFTCPANPPNGTYCTGPSLTSNIIIRCTGTTGVAGNCNDK